MTVLLFPNENAVFPPVLFTVFYLRIVIVNWILTTMIDFTAILSVYFCTNMRSLDRDVETD